MVTLYWFCLVFGGCFVLLASISGLDGVDFGDVDLDVDFDGEVQFEGDLSDGIDMDVELKPDRPKSEQQDNPFKPKPIRPNLWLPFTSLRFWTFGTCFFGLTGLLLFYLAPTLTPFTAALIALIFGLTSGTVMTGILRQLRRRPANSLIRTTDLAGKVGIVEVPFNANSTGKIRLTLKNTNVAFLARTDDLQDLQLGDRVVVIQVKDNRLWVVSEASFQSKRNEQGGFH